MKNKNLINYYLGNEIKKIRISRDILKKNFQKFAELVEPITVE